ncbi:MAG TPA: hypothetical protein VH592_18040 [Gemmataceae bacterium]
MLSTFWSALWRSGSKRTRPVRPTGVRLFLEPLEERALLSSGPTVGGTGPTPSTNSTSGSQPAVVQTSSGGTGSSGTTGSGNTNIPGIGYPLPPTSGPTTSDPSLAPITVLVPVSSTPGGATSSLGIIAVCTAGVTGSSGGAGSVTGSSGSVGTGTSPNGSAAPGTSL